MCRTLSNKLRHQRPYCFALVAIFLILLSSCPIKSSIKQLAGIPTKAAQSQANNSTPGNIEEQCLNGKATETNHSKTASSRTDNLLPNIFRIAFLFLLGFTFYKNRSNSFYSRPKAPFAVPIFLQYRKLVI